MREVPTSGFPGAPVLGAHGGLNIESGLKQPRGTHPFSKNWRHGAVRPGSSVLTAPATLTTALGNGMQWYQTLRGDFYIVVCGIESKGLVRFEVYAGIHRVAFKEFPVADLPCGNTAGVIDWTAVENNLVACGAPLSNRIVVIGFQSNGDIDIELADAIDRSVEGNEFGPADDDGPYLHLPPRAVACTTHQRRLVVLDEHGFCRWSNVDDPNAYPTNNFVRAQGSDRFDRATALAQATQGALVIFERDNIYRLAGELTAAVNAASLSLVATGVGCTSPASVQVVGSGQLLFLSERGPVQYVDGPEIPTGAISMDIGGPGSIYPLFSPEEFDIAAHDVELFRPSDTALAGAISRYCHRTQVYEIAYGALFADGVEEDHRRARIRYDLRKQTWSLEVHPKTYGMIACDDGRDTEVLMRLSAEGALIVEGVGDFDEDVVSSVTTAVDIDSALQLSSHMAAPFYGQLRKLWIQTIDNWQSTVTVRGHSADESVDEDDTQTLDVADEEKTLNTLRFGSDVLKTEKTTQHRVGVPLAAMGHEPIVRLEGNGKRWGLRTMHFEVRGGDRD